MKGVLLLQDVIEWTGFIFGSCESYVKRRGSLGEIKNAQARVDELSDLNFCMPFLNHNKIFSELNYAIKIRGSKARLKTIRTITLHYSMSG